MRLYREKSWSGRLCFLFVSSPWNTIMTSRWHFPIINTVFLSLSVKFMETFLTKFTFKVTLRPLAVFNSGCGCLPWTLVFFDYVSLKWFWSQKVLHDLSCSFPVSSQYCYLRLHYNNLVCFNTCKTLNNCYSVMLQLYLIHMLYEVVLIWQDHLVSILVLTSLLLLVVVVFF